MYGLLGGLAGKAEPPKPAGDEAYHMRVSALQTEGVGFRLTFDRPADLTGRYPQWREFVLNVGDVDDPPLGIPMGPRHFRTPGFS